MIPLVFDLISVLYGIRALGVLITLLRHWSAFWDPVFTLEDARLAQEVGFFVLIPVGVFLHEVAHWVAARQAGALYTEFHYRLFWGYVAYVGPISPTEAWWIALSGNVVSVLFGIALVLIGYYGQGLGLPARYTLFYGGRVQTVYALVGYPLLSFAGFEGDWQTIYDFSRTPVLSAVTLVLHLGVLVASWIWWEKHTSSVTE